MGGIEAAYDIYGRVYGGGENEAHSRLNYSG